MTDRGPVPSTGGPRREPAVAPGTATTGQAGTRGRRDLARLPAHGRLSEPLLAFHPTRASDVEAHPLVGLVRHGPFSSAMVNRILGPIRVGVLAPAGGAAHMATLLRELEAPHQPRERREYLKPFPGFAHAFRVGLTLADRDAVVELPAAFNTEIERAARPHERLAERLTRELRTLLARRHLFDVLLVYLPDRWRGGFWGPPEEDFDLHDYLKAFAALHDLPTQLLNEDSALAYHCRCSVAWRLGIALYVKAGGVPWKLATTDAGTAYIGVSYAVRAQADGRPQFVTCCSQVFDADGLGLEFIAYSPDEVEVAEGGNPFLSREEMRRVIARSLGLYQRRHGGRSPSRVVVHKTTEFRRDEVAGCLDALRGCDVVDLVQVQQDTPWRGLLVEPPPGREGKAVVARYPLIRGTYLPLGGRETLLWTQGDAPDAVGGRHFFKEGKGIPAPLLLRRCAGHGGWDATCADVLGLSKMNWNSDSLYDRMPVTLAFAQTLARVVKRMDRLGPRPFQMRLFM